LITIITLWIAWFSCSRGVFPEFQRKFYWQSETSTLSQHISDISWNLIVTSLPLIYYYFEVQPAIMLFLFFLCSQKIVSLQDTIFLKKNWLKYIGACVNLINQIGYYILLHDNNLIFLFYRYTVTSFSTLKYCLPYNGKVQQYFCLQICRCSWTTS
jgi:hypothetical protein